MPRAPRIEYEDAAYHVMARGNRRQPIVFNDSDREVFAAEGVMRHFLTDLNLVIQSSPNFAWPHN